MIKVLADVGARPVINMIVDVLIFGVWVGLVISVFIDEMIGIGVNMLNGGEIIVLVVAVITLEFVVTTVGVLTGII